MVVVTTGLHDWFNISCDVNINIWHFFLIDSCAKKRKKGVIAHQWWNIYGDNNKTTERVPLLVSPWGISKYEFDTRYEQTLFIISLYIFTKQACVGVWDFLLGWWQPMYQWWDNEGNCWGLCTQLILKELSGGQNLKEKKKGQDGKRPYHWHTYIHMETLFVYHIERNKDIVIPL